MHVTPHPSTLTGDVILFAGIKDKKFHHVAMVGAKHKGTEWLDYAETIWSHQELPLRTLKVGPRCILPHVVRFS